MNGRYDFLILHLLSREEMYGFQVIKKVSDRCTDAEFELKTGMLYTMCCRLYCLSSIPASSGSDTALGLFPSL